MLHQMFRFNWKAWRSLPGWQRERMIQDATQLFRAMEQGGANGHPNQSAIYSQLGHKGDLLLIHFRDTLEQLNEAELQLTKLELFDYFEPLHSYVSVVELGLYESSVKAYAALAEKGIAPHSPEWAAEIRQVRERQT
ncbi:MAG TPA: chlorite dismutase family protein, partial [Bryobacteraceae bacterium]